MVIRFGQMAKWLMNKLSLVLVLSCKMLFQFLLVNIHLFLAI